MKFIIPREVVEQEVGTGDDVFPEGTWEGTLEVVRVQMVSQEDKADFFLKNSGQYFAETCEIASLQIGENTAVLEGQRDVGGTKFFDDRIMLSYDDINWDEYENEDGDPKWQLSVTQRRLTKLANVLGLVDEVEEGIGPVDHFDELFRTTDDTDDGEGLNGMKVRFKVKHRKFATRADKAEFGQNPPRDKWSGKEAQIVQYYPAGD